jgi:hypothetical protein
MSDEMAKSCPVCGKYYPGDCYKFGCTDFNCKCDGCNVYWTMIQEDWEDYDN